MKTHPSQRTVIFGRAAISGKLKKASPITERRALYQIPDRLEICRSGNGDITTEHEENGEYRLFFGRPLAVDSKQADTFRNKADWLVRIANDVSNVDASGIFFHVTITGHDKFSIRITSDKYGFRPLYYIENEKEVYFSTHISGLKNYLEIESNGISETDLIHYYHFGFTRNDRTILRDVKKIPPGSVLALGNSKCELHRYFSVAELYRPDEFRGKSDSDLSALIERRLVGSASKWVSNTPTPAIALSGGVDSGVIAKALTDLGVAAHGYTLTYKNFYSENDRVDRLSQMLGLEVTKIEVEPEQVLSDFLTANAECSEPASFNAAIMRSVARAAARDGATTLFDGDGADRLFLGMNRYLQYKTILRAFGVAKSLGLVQPLAALLTASRSEEARKVAKLYRTWNAGMRAYPERMIDPTSAFDLDHERELYDIAIRRYDEEFTTAVGNGDFGLFFSLVSIRMCPEMFFHAPAEIQQPLGLCPAPAFWDDDLVSLAISLPTSLKLKGRHTKYILRKCAANMLGQDYAFLPKIGLQSASAFLMDSPVGQAWREKVIRQVRDSAEYDILRSRLPGGQVQAERLIPLVAWKQAWQ